VSLGNHAHSGADITSGTVPIARLPTGTTSTTVSLGNHVHSGANITSGTVAIARLPTGTTSSTVALGNHTHGCVTASATFNLVANGSAGVAASCATGYVVTGGGCYATGSHSAYVTYSFPQSGTSWY